MQVTTKHRHEDGTEHEHEEGHVYHKHANDHGRESGHDHDAHNTNKHNDGPNPFKYLIALLDEHSKSLNRLCELLELQKMKGISYHMNMTLPATGAASGLII